MAGVEKTYEMNCPVCGQSIDVIDAYADGVNNTVNDCISIINKAWLRSDVNREFVANIIDECNKLRMGE